MKQRIEIANGQRLIVRGRKSLGLTARGRVMVSPIDQTIDFEPPNRYHNLRMKHIVGPLKGLEIQFSLVLARRAKVQDVCTCPGLPFPHNRGCKKCQSQSK